MKKTEITIGQDYAVGKHLDYPGRNHGQRYRAVKTGVERRVGVNAFKYQTPVYPTDGVQMERIEAGREATGIFDVIRSADVFMPWDEYVEMIAVRDATQIEREAKQRERNLAIRARLDALIPYDEQPEQVQNLAVNDTPFSTRHYGASAEDLVALLEQVKTSLLAHAGTLYLPPELKYETPPQATESADRKRNDPSIGSAEVSP